MKLTNVYIGFIVIFYFLVTYCLLLFTFIKFIKWIIVFYLWRFFFFKQKTAYEVRISDWSSDVCSSDLGEGVGVESRTAVPDVDAEAVVLQVEGDDDRRVRGLGSVGLDGVAARLGHGEAQVVEAGVGEGRIECGSGGDDEPHDGEVVEPGRDLQDDLGHRHRLLAPVRDGVVDRGLDREDVVETRGLEHLQDPGVRAHQAQVAALAAGAAEAADQHAEPRGVDAVDILEVDDQARRAVLDQLGEPVTSSGGGGPAALAVGRHQ